MWNGVLAWLDALPDVLLYALLGVGAAVENVVPAVPADTFVVLGGFLAAVGDLQARWVFAVTWIGNVGSALIMYRVGHVHGRAFFSVGWGRHILTAHQMERLARFYARFGTLAVFLTRFLPGLRSVVPVFAGVTRRPLLPVAVPLALASAIWYGALVWVGALAGHNLDRVLETVGQVNLGLLGGAALVGGGAFLWGWRTRHHG